MLLVDSEKLSAHLYDNGFGKAQGGGRALIEFFYHAAVSMMGGGRYLIV